MELLGIIRKQQEGHKDDDVFMVGEQLLEMAEGNAEITELLAQDLQVKDMDLKAAAGKIREYADKNHKGMKCFCVTPNVADRILRKFYGLPDAPAKMRGEIMPPPQEDDGFINLDDFL